MSLYERARGHAVRMLFALVMAIGFVVLVDQVYGHSTIAFAVAVGVLIWLNMPMMRFNCPRCGQNAFFWGYIVLPWPRRSCGKCGLDLTQAE